MADNYWKRRKIQCGDLECLDLTPLAIPVGCVQPETTNEAIARILYSSGQLDFDAYNAMRGIEFDMDYDADEDFDFEDSDDDLKQSSFAKYEDEIVTDERGSANKVEIIAPAAQGEAARVQPQEHNKPVSTSDSTNKPDSTQSAEV